MKYELKENLLQALGYSLDQCRRWFWGKNWKIFNKVHSTVEELQVLLDRMIKDCETVEKVKKEIVMGKLLSLCPQEVAEYALLKKLSTILETANIIQEKLDTSHAWKRQSSYHHHHHHQERITCGNTEETKFYQHHR